MFDGESGEYLADIEHDLALAIACGESLTADPVNARHAATLARFGIAAPLDARWIRDPYARACRRLQYTSHIPEEIA